ncbi:MAG: hypothetical protein K6T83_18860, partial [Alicyclobacillus sp.]|nr:hypothetical protein [Alicyclobacillus sp.]
PTTSPAVWTRAVQDRLTAARAAAASLQTLQDQIRHAEIAFTRLQADVEVGNTRIQALLKTHGCLNGDELRALVARSVRYKTLTAELEAAAAQASASGDRLPLDTLAAEVAEAGDSDAVATRLGILQQELENLDERIEAGRKTLWEKQQEFAAWDGHQADAADAAQRAAAHLAEVDQHWNAYVRMELARRLLQRAIDAFRAEHESTVLELASHYFSRLTLGHYRGLTVDYANNMPYLFAETADARVVRVRQLSDGTRDQLFLALRLAFMEQHLRHGDPLPMIMDDILVHFDDQRAAAALDVLHELAAKTQIIYFTHQQSVAAAAKRWRDTSRLHCHDLTTLVAGAPVPER